MADQYESSNRITGGFSDTINKQYPCQHAQRQHFNLWTGQQSRQPLSCCAVQEAQVEVRGEASEAELLLLVSDRHGDEGQW